MSERRRTLFLHIGWHKTGTTAIQAMLKANRETLRRACRIYYPRTGQGGDAHHILAHSLLLAEPGDDSLWWKLADELRGASGWDTAVVSSEVLNHATPEQVENIATAVAGDWDLRAVAYLRLPDQFLEATFAEKAKSGQHLGTWAGYLKEAERLGRPGYLDVVQRWRRSLGDAGVVVRPFERAAWGGGDLFSDFFQAIGHPGAESAPGFVNPGRSNISPDVVTLSVLRELGRRLESEGVPYTSYFLKSQVCDPVLQRLADAGAGRPPARFFSSRQRAEIRDRHRPQFEELGVEFSSIDTLPEEPAQSELPEFDELPAGERGEVLMAALGQVTAELAADRGRPARGGAAAAPKPPPETGPSPAGEAAAGHGRPPVLYLHIGHGKTGTTTIQQALRDNADELRARGLLVADAKLEFPEGGPVEGHPMLLFERLIHQMSPGDARAELSRKLEPLLRRPAGGSYRGAVISSENLSSGPAALELFRELAGQFDFRVIYHVRRQDGWVESAWKQWGIKEGVDVDAYARKMLDLGWPDYLGVARGWREIAASVRVVPLDGVPDIVTDFWEALDLEGFTPPQTGRRNWSFDWSILDVLSRNPELFADIYDNRIFGMLENLMPEDAPQRSGRILSEELSAEVMEHHREANDQLREEFFPDREALHGYPRRGGPGGAGDGWGSAAAVQRFLGLQLLMLGTVDRRLEAAEGQIEELGGLAAGAPPGLALSKQVEKLKSELAAAKKDNRDLRKQSKFLVRKVGEMEGKMARSLRWRIRKLFKRRR